MRPDESGREDLMKEAVSLVPRIEIHNPARQNLAVLGFNSLDWLFVYLGSDDMYRFDEQGRLRRAFHDGKLFRSEGETLAMLERGDAHKTSETMCRDESILLRRDLTPDELESFRIRLQRDLEELIDALRDGEIIQQFPLETTGLAERFGNALERALQSPTFLAPAIVYRRNRR